jgi:DNA (cytosine-5)-methyltransferase 1
MNTAYYNEVNPYAAQWLRNLIKAGHIAAGDVDERSIVDVRADDLRGYVQCHFFAGIGGWSYALRLAGWPDDRPVWTGSCPCQPFSKVGGRKGFDDTRHLWPVWRELVAERRPAIMFGEQAASAVDWLRLVRGDLETLEYTMGSMPIEAASIGAPHKRDRFWFVAYAPSRTSGQNGEALFRDGKRGIPQPPSEWRPWGFRGRSGAARHVGKELGWATEPNVGRVAHGIPAGVDQLRALGNAIVPQVAAEFIAAADGG